jgi:hypothetical protein
MHVSRLDGVGCSRAPTLGKARGATNGEISRTGERRTSLERLDAAVIHAPDERMRSLSFSFSTALLPHSSVVDDLWQKFCYP